MVYRFCTANSVEQLILERAESKRKLEKLVIHKGSDLHDLLSSDVLILLKGLSLVFQKRLLPHAAQAVVRR